MADTNGEQSNDPSQIPGPAVKKPGKTRGRVKAKARKTQFITFRISSAEEKQLELDASRANKTASTYMRYCFDFTRTVAPLYEELAKRLYALEVRQNGVERELPARIREWGGRLSEEIATALSDSRIGEMIVDTVHIAVPKAIDETMERLRRQKSVRETG
jgi:hypothetical protein